MPVRRGSTRAQLPYPPVRFIHGHPPRSRSAVSRSVSKWTAVSHGSNGAAHAFELSESRLGAIRPNRPQSRGPGSQVPKPAADPPKRRSVGSPSQRASPRQLGRERSRGRSRSVVKRPCPGKQCGRGKRRAGPSGFHLEAQTFDPGDSTSDDIGLGNRGPVSDAGCRSFFRRSYRRDEGREILPHMAN